MKSILIFGIALSLSSVGQSYMGVSLGYANLPKEKMNGIDMEVLFSRKLNKGLSIDITSGFFYNNQRGIFKREYKGAYSILDQNFQLPSAVFNQNIDKEEYLKRNFGFIILNPKPDSYYIYDFGIGLKYSFPKLKKIGQSIRLSMLFSYHDFNKYSDSIEVTYRLLDEYVSFLHYIPYYKHYYDLGLSLNYSLAYELTDRINILTNISGKFYTSTTKSIAVKAGLGIKL